VVSPLARASLLGVAAVVFAIATPAAAEAARGSPRVAALQVALRGERVYTGDVDGWAGPQTRRAVRRLQRRRGLVVDGVAGPATLRALGRRGRPRYGSRAITLGARGWDVGALQFLLAWRGFPSGPMDGGFGPRTRSALIRYQAWAGLSADGIAGRGTLPSLLLPPPRSPVALLRPVAGILSDRFGPRGSWFHPGLDFAAPTGTRVHAARAGRVAFAGWDAGGYGEMVVLDHGGGVTTRYAHLSRIAVSAGTRVAAGATIGRVGATGHATGPHLHFELRVRDAATDPLPAMG
jgi:peptidoglycan hydrolase-like protein with peptidoglycan-binding domain